MSISPRVLVAEEDISIRARIRAALERDGIEVCAEAAEAGEAVEAALREHPDACLLDVGVPGDGISAASTISSRMPGTVVLMLTPSLEADGLFESVRRGAAGYLRKDMDPAKLPLAVRAALKDEVRNLTAALREELPAATASPRVLVADDHAPTRAGVRIALERDGIDVCAEAADAREAVRAALRERPDACVLDVSMPGGGISAASTIISRLPDTVVLMLTAARDDDDLLESLRRGAAGYLLKDMDPTKLPVAVRAALEGEISLPRNLAARLVEELRNRPRDRRRPTAPAGRPRLTRREWEVLELLCEQANTTEIASRLFLSPVTVRRHVSSILRKLGVSSRDEAVRLVLADDPSAA